MKLFSEQVNLTSTNSSLNIIYVENYEEIFFNVYEIEINKTKYISEKISIHDGCPVISVPVTVENEQIYYPFVLKKGEQNIVFNENNTAWEDVELPTVEEPRRIFEEVEEEFIETPEVEPEEEIIVEEKVFDPSELNILQVENYEEIFFNVYE